MPDERVTIRLSPEKIAWLDANGGRSKAIRFLVGEAVTTGRTLTDKSVSDKPVRQKAPEALAAVPAATPAAAVLAAEDNPWATPPATSPRDLPDTVNACGRDRCRQKWLNCRCPDKETRMAAARKR